MSNETHIWGRPDLSYRPSTLGTGVLVLALACAWLGLYSISILGSFWRLRNPDAPAPELTTGDQVADLVALTLQFAVGVVAVLSVSLLRRRVLTTVLPGRSGSAADAAIAWCAAIAASSACALMLDRLGLARFDLSVPAVVESPTLAVVAAVSAGLREEPLLAAVPVLLLVGRIPIGWIMILAGAMRGSLYLYFGGGGFVWAALWGAAAVGVYYKYRRLWVLVVVHGFVMNIQALDRIIDLDSAAMVLQWGNVLVLFGALALWIVPRALDTLHLGEEKAESSQSTPVVADTAAELPFLPPDETRPNSETGSL